MDSTPLFSQSPFAILTFIVAPAMLTNTSSVLAMSTINRMLKTRDRMHELYVQSQSSTLSPDEAKRISKVVNRVEKQAVRLLDALRATYVALASFAGATLVTLLGAALSHFQQAFWFRILVVTGLALGGVGVLGLIYGSASLFQATRLSLLNIREEAFSVRAQHGADGTH